MSLVNCMFWTQFEALCVQCGKAPNAVAADLKIPSGSITAWSKGTQPRNTTIKKIADYFGVTVQYLLFGETDTSEIKKDPSQMGEVEMTDTQKEAWELIQSWDDEKLKRFIAAAKAMLGE